MSIAADSAASEFANNPPLPVALVDRSFTPDDLLALPNESHFELVDGRLVERNMGNRSSFVASNMHLLIGAYVKRNKLGWTYLSDAGFRMSPDAPKTVRKPDVSFVQRGRLPNRSPSPGYDTLAPDLVVEVLSPNDLAAEVDIKRDEYLRDGVRLLWIVSPETKSIQVFRADGSSSLLREADELSGEDVLPGFRCLVSAAFEEPDEG